MNNKWKIRIPLFAVILLPSILGVILITSLSWRLFDPAVERSSETALSVVDELIKGTGNAALSYPVSAGEKAEVERILRALTNNSLVFAAQVSDADGNLIARYQNESLPIEKGIQIQEYREKLYYETTGDDPTTDEGRVYVGEVLYQLTPYVVNAEKNRLRSQYRKLVIGLVILVLGGILLATRLWFGPMRNIKIALGQISQGNTEMKLSEDSVISEIQSIQRGVNHLSQSAKAAVLANELALAEKENALEKERAAERESQLMLGVATREIADPVMKIVELLRLNEGSNEPLVSSDVILECAEQVQVSILGMMGKLREQRVSSGLSEIALVDYFHALTNRYSNRFSAKGLELKEKLLGTVDDAPYKFDVRMIDIVLEKVLENALNYTEDGTVNLKWSVNHDNHSDHVLNIDVEDTGRGMDRGDLNRVFDRYFRSSEVVSDDLPGSGLGLYIAREIVEALGGSISAESEATYGSRFSITLPIARVENKLSDSEKSAGKTVLLVGAQVTERDRLEAILAGRGMIVFHAETSIEGLLMMSEQGFDYLLIEESVSNPDVDSFIEEVQKQKIHMGIGVLTEGEGQVQDGIRYMGRKVKEAELAEMFETTGEFREVGTVDYSLKKRFESDGGSPES